MKISILVLMVLLIGCSPSSEVIQQAIYQTQTSVGKTQEAIPTSTYIPTLAPTNTPLPDIKTLIISQPELNAILPGIFLSAMMIIEDSTESEFQLFTGAYRPVDDSGAIGISLVKFLDNIHVSNFIDTLKNGGLGDDKDKDISLPQNLVLPKDSFAYRSKENKLIMGFSQSNVAVMFEYVLSKGIIAEDAISFVSLVAQAQSTKLANAGYK
jgi:hypothetical protein